MPTCAAIIFTVIILFAASLVYCGQVDDTFGELKSELRNLGVSEEFIRTTESPVRRIIASNVKISDVKTVLLDLWNQNVKARALRNAITAVAELVASGDDVLEAASIASGAADKAEAEGLSGFGVGMRVKKAVQERKAYLKGLKI
jgi:hypothetical protein